MVLASLSNSLKPPINLKEWHQTLVRLRNIWTDLSQDQQALALERILEVELARETNPLQFFIPNGAQEEAIREIGNLENFIVLEVFANGVGKTAVTFAILGAIQWGAPTAAFAYPLYQTYPEKWPKRIRIVTESGLVSEIGPIQMEAAKWWPKGRYQWLKGGKPYNSVFYTDTGFFGEVMTFEQAVKEFEGKTIGINVFIEPPPKEIFSASVARQRKGGINIFDMTPLMSAAWVLDDIVSNPVIIIEGKEVGRAKCINADIEANCIEHGQNGQLEHNDILQIISRYDPDEIDARAHGKFMHLSGRIYKTFDRNVHVSKEPITVPDVCTVFQVVDPAIGKPFAVIYAFVDQSQTINIFKEWPETNFEGAKDSNLGVKDYADLFKSLETGFKVQTRILDRHFGNVRRTPGGPTLKEQFGDLKKSHGIENVDFEDSYAVGADLPEVETGILAVKDCLAYDKTRQAYVEANGPRIRISPACKNTIASFEKWSRDPDTGKVKDEYKDFADDVRYLVMSKPTWEPPRKWEQPRQPHYGVGT